MQILPPLRHIPLALLCHLPALQTFQAPPAGSATPSTVSVKRGQNIVIAWGGGKIHTKSGAISWPLP